MKYEITIICTLLILITTSLVFSCNKEQKENIDKLGYAKMQSYYNGVDRGIGNSFQRRSNPNQFYFSCADSWGSGSEINNKGLAAEVDVKRLRLGNASMKSWWIAMTANYIDANGNTVKDWTQWGYACDGQLFPGFFRYRWINGNMGQSPPTIVYSGLNVPLEYNTIVRFEMKNVEGTTWWAFSRNGQEVFRADLEVTEMSGHLEACTESWGGGSFSPAIMTYYMDIYKDGVWSHVPTGISNQFAWGINGQVQRPEFGKSQFVIGGNTSMPAGTPWLWFP